MKHRMKWILFVTWTAIEKECVFNSNKIDGQDICDKIAFSLQLLCFEWHIFVPKFYFFSYYVFFYLKKSQFYRWNRRIKALFFELIMKKNRYSHFKSVYYFDDDAPNSVYRYVCKCFGEKKKPKMLQYL